MKANASPRQGVSLPVLLLTLPEVAEVLRSRLPFVRTLVRTGVLPYMRSGKRFVVPRTALEAYITAHTRREGKRA